MVKTRLLFAELLNEGLDFSFKIKQKNDATPTSIFNVYKGRSISHKIMINPDEELIVNHMSLGYDFYPKDLLRDLGLTKAAELNATTNKASEAQQQRAVAYEARKASKTKSKQLMNRTSNSKEKPTSYNNRIPGVKYNQKGFPVVNTRSKKEKKAIGYDENTLTTYSE